LHESTSTDGVLMRKAEPSPEEALRLQVRSCSTAPQHVRRADTPLFAHTVVDSSTYLHLEASLATAQLAALLRHRSYRRVHRRRRKRSSKQTTRGLPSALRPPHALGSLGSSWLMDGSRACGGCACSRDGAATKMRINKCAAENDPKTAIEM
jgi:hypothetical protein